MTREVLFGSFLICRGHGSAAVCARITKQFGYRIQYINLEVFCWRAADIYRSDAR